MLLIYGIGKGGDPATERYGRLTLRAGAGEEADSGGHLPTSEGVRVHVDGGSKDFFIKSLSEHYNAPGRLAEYKRQFQRAFRRPGDDPSIFATELETLARRAFMDIDRKIQLQMVRDRFIDGQAERALRRLWTVWARILL